MASITTMKMYTIGTAINAPPIALIQSLVFSDIFISPEWCAILGAVVIVWLGSYASRSVRCYRTGGLRPCRNRGT